MYCTLHLLFVLFYSQANTYDHDDDESIWNCLNHVGRSLSYCKDYSDSHCQDEKNVAKAARAIWSEIFLQFLVNCTMWCDAEVTASIDTATRSTRVTLTMPVPHFHHHRSGMTRRTEGVVRGPVSHTAWFTADIVVAVRQIGGEAHCCTTEQVPT